MAANKFLNIAGIVFVLLVVVWVGSYLFSFNQEEDQRVSLQEVKESASDTVEAAQQYTSQQKDVYLKRVHEEIESMDQQLANIEEQANSEIKAEMNRAIAELKERREEFIGELDSIRSNMKAEWEDTQTKLDAAMNDLKEGYSDAISRFGTDGQNTQQQAHQRDNALPTTNEKAQSE